MKTFILSVIILFLIAMCCTLFVILKSNKNESYLIHSEVTKDADKHVMCHTLKVSNTITHHRWLTERQPCRYETVVCSPFINTLNTPRC